MNVLMQSGESPLLSLGNAFEPEEPGRAGFVAAAEQALLERMDARKPGLFLAAPERVDPGSSSSGPSLPLYGARVASLTEAATSRLDASLVVAAVCLTTHRVLAAMAFDTPTEVETEDDGETTPPDGLCGATFELDAARRLALPSRQEKYLVLVLLRDRVSNGVVVEVAPPPGVFRDPEVERALKARLLSEGPREPWPPPEKKAARYRRLTNPPPAPSLGITLQAERVVVLEEGEPWRLRGSFRLPLLPHERGTDPTGPRAVVTVTLLAMGSATARPRLASLALPAYDVSHPLDRDEGEFASGTFDLDLRTLPGLALPPQTVWIRALHGAGISAPVTTALVDPSSVVHA
jgi:hypothetical protein